MILGPPGLPITMKGWSSLVMMVGLILLRGRFLGPIALASVPTRPYTFGIPGWALKSSISLLRIMPVPSTTIPEPEPTSATTTPDTPFVVAVATVDMLEVFDELEDDEARWLLPNPGPGDGPRTLLVLGSDKDWLRVSIPIRPNGTVGWVRNGDVSTATYRARIIVDLYRGRLEAWEDGALVVQGAIASGAEETPTPPGGFFVTEIQEHIDPATGGTAWLIGTSAYSEALYPTAAGDPAVAILAVGDTAHLSQTISLGCVRIHPDVLERLALLPVGTPVQILG